MKKLAHAILLAGIAAAAPAAAQPAPTPAPAPAAQAKHYTTADTDLATLLDDPAAKAVLVKHIPDIVGDSQIEMARGMTLKMLQQFTPEALADPKLAAIDADLAKLPQK